MKKFILLLLGLLLCMGAYLTYWRLPASKPAVLPPLPVKSDILLVPLDSRPVCTAMVQKLGRLAGLNVILPPKAFLDNYQTPADRQKLLPWLQSQAGHYPYAILSTELLLHGGLLHSRQDTASPEEQKQLITELQSFTSRQKQTDIFSVIPRLLVSDQLLPDRWYQYQLMRYSQLADMVEINGDYALTQKLLTSQSKIPPEILQKYLRLYQASDDFNRSLLQLAHSNTNIIIGQDDTSPLGLPHRSAQRLQTYMETRQLTSHASLTYGADEIAVLLLTRYFVQQTGRPPQVYLQYAHPGVEFMYMPYMAVSVGAALDNQLQLIGAKQAATPQQADFICYISCGSDKWQPCSQQAEAINTLLAQDKKVAVIDLSANFEASELLLPQLLKQNVPLNKLIAYAGWNTFSNSSGTALAQAVIFTERLQALQQRKAETAEIAALYAANLNFTAERILEDYYYQKLLHPPLREKLASFGTDSANLTEAEKQQTEYAIQSKLSLQAELLLRRNLGRTPFFRTQQQEYYLRNLNVGAQLPWNRIFEVKLNVYNETGVNTTH